MLDRIAPTAAPRSSLIISDEPPNREQNYRTEFVVVLNNQPQGGLAIRKPAADVVARDGVRLLRLRLWAPVRRPVRWHVLLSALVKARCIA